MDHTKDARIRETPAPGLGAVNCMTGGRGDDMAATERTRSSDSDSHMRTVPANGSISANKL